MIAFARRHRDALTRLSAAFVSVTLSEAGAEDSKRSDADRRTAAADAQRMIDVFVEETGWQPEHALPVAGALVYSKYNFLVRFLMKRIARPARRPTSRDYEFTDWPAGPVRRRARHGVTVTAAPGFRQPLPHRSPNSLTTQGSRTSRDGSRVAPSLGEDRDAPLSARLLPIRSSFF
jgi:hypothetical protein